MPAPTHSERRCDVAIVGGGILGLAHAVIALQRGRSVRVFERSPRAVGASVRNFGLVWPIGHAAGEAFDRALRGRRMWQAMAERAGFGLQPFGSLFVAHHDDEMRVLEEFFERRSAGHDLRLASPDEVRALAPAVCVDGLRGGLFSATEMGVDPRQAIAGLTAWIDAQPGAAILSGTPVRAVGSGWVETSAGARWRAEHVVVCPGDDLLTLYPELFARSDLIRVKLQMMRTAPQPDGWRLGPALAGGLTLCHYDSFAGCPGVTALRARLQRELPDYFAHGIHVLAAQNARGEVLIGDSHEYGNDFDPEHDASIDERILGYLRRLVTLPAPRIASRWHGTYARRRDGEPFLRATPEAGVTVVSGVGGGGMTLAFALAEETWAGLG